MARPTKYDETRAKAILDNLRRGNTRRASAGAAGICEDTLAAWLKRYPDFSAEIKKAEWEAETAHVANIGRWAASGNWQASAWWLERKRPEDWKKPADAPAVSVIGQSDGPVTFTIRIDRADRDDS